MDSTAAPSEGQLRDDRRLCRHLFDARQIQPYADAVDQDGALVDQVLSRDLVLHEGAHGIHRANIFDGLGGILITSKMIEDRECKSVVPCIGRELFGDVFQFWRKKEIETLRGSL